MTYLAAVLGLLPFLLNISEGTEMLRPLGVAVIGGITWSLLITFVFVPVVYSTVRRNSHREPLITGDLYNKIKGGLL